MKDFGVLLIDYQGGRLADAESTHSVEDKIDVDMWELDDGTKLLYCINNRFLVVFTQSRSMVKVVGMKWHLKHLSIKLALSELSELLRTSARPWWLYGMS